MRSLGASLVSLPKEALNTPRIRVTLKEGLIKLGGLYNPDLEVLPTRYGHIYQGVVFKNQIVSAVFGRSSSSTSTSAHYHMIQTTDINGASLSSGVTVSAHGSSMRALRIHPNGQTLEAYWGATDTLYMSASSNGTTWGGTVAIGSLPSGVSWIVDISVAGSSRIYMLATFNESIHKKDADNRAISTNLYLAENTGSWAIKKVAEQSFFIKPEEYHINSRVGGVYLNALAGKSDFNYLYVLSQRYGRERQVPGQIRKLKSDGNNILYNEDFLGGAEDYKNRTTIFLEGGRDTQYSGYVRMNSVAIGMSYSYMPVMLFQRAGATERVSEEEIPILFESVHGDYWIPHHGGYRYFNAHKTRSPITTVDSYAVHTVITGTSTNLAWEAMFLATTEQNRGYGGYLYRGRTEYDLSNDLISYSNANNENVSIVISNLEQS